MTERTESAAPPAQLTREPGKASRNGTVARPARDTDGNDNDTAAAIRRQIGERGARTVRLRYTDLLGQAGFVLIPAADLKRVLAGSIAIPDAVDTAANLSPDPRTLRFLPSGDSTAATAHLTCDIRLPDGTAAPGCARQALRRALESFRKVGLTVRVNIDCLLPVFAEQSVDGALLALAIEPVVAALADCPLPGLTVSYQAQCESMSISFGPLPPLEAADALALVKYMVGWVMQRHGAAPFAVLPSPSRFGLAVYRGKRSLFSGQGAGHDAAAAFVAGTRAHAPGLTALLRPALDGEAVRIWPDTATTLANGPTSWAWESGWAGPLGIQRAGGEGRLTVTGLDGTGNPYLMLAGLLSSGLDGLRRTAGTNAADSKADGTPPCPPDPAHALAGLVTDECLRDGLAGPTVDAYAEAVRIRWQQTRP